MLRHEIEFKTPQIPEKPLENGKTVEEFRPENFDPNKNAAENSLQPLDIKESVPDSVAEVNASLAIEHNANQLHALEEMINTGKINVADIEIGNKKSQTPASAAAKAILQLKD